MHIHINAMGVLEENWNIHVNPMGNNIQLRIHVHVHCTLIVSGNCGVGWGDTQAAS